MYQQQQQNKKKKKRKGYRLNNLVKFTTGLFVLTTRIRPLHVFYIQLTEQTNQRNRIQKYCYMKI